MLNGLTGVKLRNLHNISKEVEINNLPNELLFLIFQYLSCHDVVSKICLTCLRWNQLANGEPMWKFLFETQFPFANLSCRTQEKVTYKNLFREYFCQKLVFDSTLKRGCSQFSRPLFLLPEGKLVNPLDDYSIEILDIEKKEGSQILKGHNLPVTSLLLLTSGNLVSASYYGDVIKVWDIETGMCLGNLAKSNQSVTSLLLLPNGKVLIGFTKGCIQIWDIEASMCLGNLVESGQPVSLFLLLPNGHLVSGSYDGSIKVWDIEKEVCLQTLKQDISPILSLLLLPNGHLVSGSHNGSIRVWDIKKEKCLQTLKEDSPVSSLVLLPNGHLVSASHNGFIRVWALYRTKIDLSTTTY